MSKYEDLDIWHRAMDITEDVYKLTNEYPAEEKFNLMTHTRKTAISIPSNIAEGRGRRSDTEFNRFLNIAIGSAYELETQIELAVRLNYISQEKKTTICDKLSTLLKKIQTLQTKIKPQTADR